MIVAINYADENFKKSQEFNTKTAYKKGKVDKVIEYSPKDIDNVFFEENKKILSQKRGGGYWLWKPYIILKTLESLKDGDYLFYCDSGAFYVDKVKKLINDLERSKQEIMLFELPLIEQQWTKKELFEKMGLLSDNYLLTNQILSGYFLVKKNNKTINFFKEYLELACKKDVLNDKSNKNQQYTNFIDHRHDQSLLSLLSKKREISPFKDPSQYGERPWEYRANNRLYNLKEYKNSTYSKIVVSNRKVNPKVFLLKENVKTLLYKVGIMSEEKFLKKNNIED